MHLRSSILVGCISLMFSVGCYADGFTGTWSLDLRSPTERQQGVECGIATFSLKQTGSQIVGDHTFATPGCGRLNEGGEGTVKGSATGNTAVLIVTSGRNGAVVRGHATMNGASLLKVFRTRMPPYLKRYASLNP